MFAAAIWFADLIDYDFQYASFDHATATPSFAISNNFNKFACLRLADLLARHTGEYRPSEGRRIRQLADMRYH